MVISSQVLYPHKVPSKLFSIAIDIREASGAKTGKGWYTFVMVKELLKRDPNHRFLLYTQERNPAYDAFKNAEQIVIKRKGIGWHLAALWHLWRAKPNVFWAPTSYIIPALAPRSLKTVTTVHDIVSFLFPEGHNKKAVWLERLTLRRAVKKSRHIVAPSHNTKQDLLKMFGTPEKKITVALCAAAVIFHPPEDSKTFEEVRQKYNLPKKFLLAVGTLSPRKNFERLIRAYARILPKHPETHLVIVGPSGWNFEELLAFTESEKVHFIGYAEGADLVALYSMAAAFVFPSLYEGFGIPPLEAMACGCPVITSNGSSLPEVVGNAALLVDPYSLEDIARAIDAVLSDPTLAHDLKQKGFERVKKFSWAESARTVHEILMVQ